MTIFHSYVSLPEGSLKLLPEKGTNNNKQHIFFTLNSQTWNQPNIWWPDAPSFIIFTNIHNFLTPKNGTLVFCTFEPEYWLHGVPKCPKLGQAQLSLAAKLAWIELLSVVVTSEEMIGPRNPCRRSNDTHPARQARMPRHHLKDQSMVLWWWNQVVWIWW